MSCIYRIYPSWWGFGGNTAEPMHELARDAATSMGRRVVNIVKYGSGFDDRSGYFVDFRVTYSSTRTPGYEELAR